MWSLLISSQLWRVKVAKVTANSSVPEILRLWPQSSQDSMFCIRTTLIECISEYWPNGAVTALFQFVLGKRSRLWSWSLLPSYCTFHIYWCSSLSHLGKSSQVKEFFFSVWNRSTRLRHFYQRILDKMYSRNCKEPFQAEKYSLPPGISLWHCVGRHSRPDYHSVGCNHGQGI